MAPQTAKEKSRSYRDRIKSDPVKYAEFLRKDRERYQRKKEKGIVKQVQELPKREQRKLRRQWRITQRNRRDRLKEVLETASSTPTASPAATTAPERPCQPETQKKKRKRRTRQSRCKDNDLNEAKAKLEKALRRVEKYKKRCHRLQNKMEQNGTPKVETPKSKTKQQLKQGPKQLRRTLLFHNSIISEIKAKYDTGSRKGRQIISKIVAGRIVKKYRVASMLKKEFGFSSKLQRANVMRTNKLEYTRKKQQNKIGQDVRKMIEEFLERDSNSRATTGKKETITRKREKKQKRFLIDSLSALHAKFRQAYPNVKISYAEFCRQRPFWIVKPSIKDRETCMCKLHSNMQFMANRLFYHKVIQTSKLTDLILSITCASPTKECMYRECEKCKERQLATSAYDSAEGTVWFQWKSVVEEREKKKTRRNKGDNKSSFDNQGEGPWDPENTIGGLQHHPEGEDGEACPQHLPSTCLPYCSQG